MVYGNGGAYASGFYGGGGNGNSTGAGANGQVNTGGGGGGSGVGFYGGKGGTGVIIIKFTDTIVNNNSIVINNSTELLKSSLSITSFKDQIVNGNGFLFNLNDPVNNVNNVPAICLYSIGANSGNIQVGIEISGFNPEVVFETGSLEDGRGDWNFW